jgi:hypothetical protein
MITRRTFLSLAPAVLVLQAAPPVEVLRLTRLRQAYTLLRDAITDAAAAGVITTQALSLVANWYPQAVVLLETDGVTPQIDTVLADLMTGLSNTDRQYLHPYVTLIVTLRQAAMGAA